MRAALIPGLAVAVLSVSACAGPRADLQVGTQTAPINLVLGARQAVEAAPVGPVIGPLPPGLAPFVPQLPTGPEVIATASALPVVPEVKLPCPPFDVLSPVVATGITIPGPPVPATYPYRGKVVDTAGAAKATYSGDSSWKVTTTPVDPTDGSYEVTTDVALGRATSSRVFRVLTKPIVDDSSGLIGTNSPDGTDPNVIVAAQVNSTLVSLGLPPVPRLLPNPGRYGVPGIYLVSQTSGSTTFTPSLPIPILQTPVGNNSFTGMGTDGSTVMTYTSTVKKRSNVNACGTKVEGIEVNLTDGNIAGLNADGKVQQVAFTETLVFGLQFGGLPVQDNGLITTASAPGAALAPDQASRDFSFTVNTVPKPART